ncbi:MAG: helix-turn-helix domain-containing protein [Lachnospiraceae bacterium]|nr:helix-turn-helix domain-containing protein [Lachnospiraceae bacterium]
MTTGEKIAMLRKGKGITQEQLAEILGVARQSVSRWEMDLAFPETEKLIRLSKLFSCSIDFLLNEVTNGNRQVNEDITATVCVTFIRECGYFFLATSVNEQPRLRPFGMISTDGQSLFIATDSRKSVYSDLEQNSKIELASYNPITGKWIRISGTAKKNDTPVSQELMWTAYPMLCQKYSKEQEKFLVIYQIDIEKADLQ